MTKRKAEYPINSLILNRWSPRAMSGEPITQTELMTLFEAGRWAPSSYNNQPWYFVYAVRTSSTFSAWLDLLVEFNREWCIRASALVATISKNNFHYNNKPSRTHAFDTGAAWENIALQGATMGLVVHGMEGLDYDRATQYLKIPAEHTLHMMFAVGKPGNKEVLPAKMQEEEHPNDRKKIDTFVFENFFKQ